MARVATQVAKDLAGIVLMDDDSSHQPEGHAVGIEGSRLE